MNRKILRFVRPFSPENPLPYVETCRRFFRCPSILAFLAILIRNLSRTPSLGNHSRELNQIKPLVRSYPGDAVFPSHSGFHPGNSTSASRTLSRSC